MSDLRVDEATVGDATVVWETIRAAYSARPHVDPPSSALMETVESVTDAIRRGGGLLCHVDGRPAGSLLFLDAGSALAIRRLSVAPYFRSRGVGTGLVGVAEQVAARRGYDDIHLLACPELTATSSFWTRLGYAEVGRDGAKTVLGKALPVEVQVPVADDTRGLGRQVGTLVKSGDVVVLVGELGAGKTTFTQGLGAGLGVRGDVTSPTFVISRVHPSLVDGPSLVHVDAYRLGDSAELDDLDLDASVDRAVTVVEWGKGLAEALAEDRLGVHLARGRGADIDDRRTVTVTPVGPRWYGTGLRSTLLGTHRRVTDDNTRGAGRG